MRELLVNVQQAKTDDGSGLVPVFQYFKYDFATAGAAAQPTEPLIGTGTDGALSADEIESIAKITITYKANPARKRSGRQRLDGVRRTRCSPAPSTPTPTRTR